MKIAQRAMLLSAAFGAATATLAHAQITLQITPIPWNLSNTNAATLNTNGWAAYKLTLVADGTVSTGVFGFDFAGPISGVTDAAHNPDNLPFGISAAIHQSYSINDDGTGNGNIITSSTPVAPSTANNGGLPQPTTTTSQIDSFWAHYPASYNFGNVTPFQEDSNLFNLASNLPDNYSGSPIADTAPTFDPDGNILSPGRDNGVGLSMTYAGLIRPIPNPSDPAYATSIHAAPISMDLAYIIVPSPRGSDFSFTLFGAAVDPNGQFFAIQYGTPEPATSALMAIGAVTLLARKRTNTP